MNIYKYFTFAKSISKFSDFYGDKTSKHVGCVIVYKNKVIAVGWNTSKEHPLQKEYNRQRDFNVDFCKNSLHAEIYALIRCNYADVEWSKASIFIYRELASGIVAMARPCMACTKAIRDRGIKTVFYTTENGYAKEVFGE
jgi:deoxycytidylate deaminase